jgi:osmotically-inducible protein OsmY
MKSRHAADSTGNHGALGPGKKIHAELMKTNVDLKFIHIDVIEAGVARISGMVLSPDDQTTITETVESVAGISSIQAQIVPIPQGYG